MLRNMEKCSWIHIQNHFERSSLAHGSQVLSLVNIHQRVHELSYGQADTHTGGHNICSASIQRWSKPLILYSFPHTESTKHLSKLVPERVKGRMSDRKLLITSHPATAWRRSYCFQLSLFVGLYVCLFANATLESHEISSHNFYGSNIWSKVARSSLIMAAFWYMHRRAWVMGCYIWYSKEGSRWAAAPSSLLLTVSNVTAHPSTASVSITVLLYDGPLRCGFNVAIKGLRQITAAALTNFHIPRTYTAEKSQRLHSADCDFH